MTYTQAGIVFCTWFSAVAQVPSQCLASVAMRSVHFVE